MRVHLLVLALLYLLWIASLDPTFIITLCNQGHREGRFVAIRWNFIYSRALPVVDLSLDQLESVTVFVTKRVRQ